MAKVEVKNFSEIAKRFDKFLAEKLEDRALKEAIAERSISYIQGKTRMGYDLTQEGAKQPPLAKSSIKNREYLEEYNITDSRFSLKRSNLTFSGQLLKSLFARFEPGKIIIEANNDVRKPYNSKNGPANQRITNSELAGYLEENGRTFLGLDAKGQEIIRAFVVRQVRRLLSTIKKIEV